MRRLLVLLVALLPAIASSLAMSYGADDPQEAWVEAMQKVHARFKGTPARAKRLQKVCRRLCQ